MINNTDTLIENPRPVTERTKLYSLLCTSIALAFAYFMANHPVDAFYDRLNYLNYAENANILLFQLLDKPLTSILFNEPVWLTINYFLSQVTTPENVLRTYLFLSTSLVTFLLLKNNPKHFLLVLCFILLPQFLKNYVVHLRQGLALSFFMVGWFAINRKVKWTFFLIAPLVHSSFFFIVFFIFFQKSLTRLKVTLHWRFALFFAGVTCLSIGSLWVADYFGARQGERYFELEPATSGGGLIFWFLFFIVLCFQGKRFIQQNILTFSILMFYFISYFTLSVAGRIFESGLIIVLLSALQLTNIRRVAFYILFFAYFFTQWTFRINAPYFGWAS